MWNSYFHLTMVIITFFQGYIHNTEVSISEEQNFCYSTFFYAYEKEIKMSVFTAANSYFMY